MGVCLTAAYYNRLSCIFRNHFSCFESLLANLSMISVVLFRQAVVVIEMINKLIVAYYREKIRDSARSEENKYKVQEGGLNWRL